MKQGIKEKSLLFISIDFPPMRTSGIYRPVYFTKALIEDGWKVTLLTSESHLSTIIDESISAEIHPELRIVHASAPMPRRMTGKIFEKYKQAEGAKGAGESSGPKRTIKTKLLLLFKRLILSPGFRIVDNLLLVPDNYVIWCVKNMFKAYRLIKRHRVTHLVATSQPQSVQVMGLILKYLTGVKLIADFRDSWTDHQTYSFRIRGVVERFWENKVFKNASVIVNMSEGDLDRLRLRKPEIPTDKLIAITNGFNETDFSDLPESKRTNDSGPVRLLYVGSMYPHSGDSCVEALKIVKDKGCSASDIEIAIIGFTDESFDSLVEKHDLSSMINNRGFMKHEDLLLSYADYDVMLLVTGGTPHYHPGMLPGKVFEYMRLGKPVLHAGLDGSAHKILARSGLEIYLPLDNVEDIALAMVDLIDRKRSGNLSMEPNWEFIHSYQWKNLGHTFSQRLSAIQ